MCERETHLSLVGGAYMYTVLPLPFFLQNRRRRFFKGEEYEDRAHKNAAV